MMRLRRDADFAKLWSGQVISEFGSVVSGTAIPIAALLVLGATPLEFAAIVVARSVAVTLTSLVAGAWSDRIARRPLMIAADLGRAFTLAVLPVAAFTGLLRIEHFYAVAFVNGILGTLFEVAYHAYVPTLVGKDRLLRANATLEGGAEATWIVAPALAGALIQIVTAPVTILIDALSFVVSAVSIGWIRAVETRAARVERRSLRREIGEGLHVVWHDAALRALVSAEAVYRFFGSFFGTLYTIYALTELRLEPLHLGLAISAGGLAGLVGAIATPAVTKRFGARATIIYGGGILAVLAYAPLPFAFGPPLVALAFLLFQQIFGDFWGAIGEITLTTLRQSLAPERVLARVMSVQYFLVGGIAPLGAVLGAAIAETYGVRVALLVAVAGSALGTLILVASPIRDLRAPRPLPAARAEVPA